MQPTQPLLDIDHLRRYEATPAYFGLGFIQLKIKDNSRIHFYHEDLPVLAEEPHDHRYSFMSYILQGQFDQDLYDFHQTKHDGTHEIVWEDCKPKSGGQSEKSTPGILKKIFSGTYQAGDYYEIDADTLHTVVGRENAITYLVRDEPYKDFAGVVREIGAEAVCPFSQSIPVDYCWEMIESMLPKADKKKKKSKFGYHVADIPKGKVGEPSKIVEEAMEIADAHEQGVKVMAAVEMSDVYGALDRYREKHHPELTMDDIRAMYNVTRRAFDNGKRK